MTEAVVQLLPGTVSLLRAQQGELPQKDGLCGGFWGLTTLRAFGHRGRVGEESFDQEGVAEHAGTALTPLGIEAPRPVGEPAQSDYRLILRRASNDAAAGVSAGGLARAIEELAGGQLAVVPVVGPWAGEPINRLLSDLACSGEGIEIACLANLSTGLLWGSHASPFQLVSYLFEGNAVGPPADWNVGHFAALVGLVTGPSGTLVMVADSYRTLGNDGVYFQPLERLVVSLRREGTSRGGLLLVTSAEDRNRVIRVVNDAGMDVGLWHNGSSEIGGVV